MISDQVGYHPIVWSVLMCHVWGRHRVKCRQTHMHCCCFWLRLLVNRWNFLLHFFFHFCFINLCMLVFKVTCFRRRALTPSGKRWRGGEQQRVFAETGPALQLMRRPCFTLLLLLLLLWCSLVNHLPQSGAPRSSLILHSSRGGGREWSAVWTHFHTNEPSIYY